MHGSDKVNILLVDDQPGKLISYEVILGELQENLIKAGSAKDALQFLLKNDVAVVLVDVCMPDMDGFELAGMIRKHPRCDRTAIILVSAVHLSDFDRLRGYGCGAVDYVPVPVVPDLLRAKVGVFVDLYRKTEQLSRLNAELERRVAERTAELERTMESERRARAGAEEANRLKDDFLATLSHELRTPINAVLAWVQLLRNGSLDAETTTEGLNVIERGVRTQVRLIDELLDVNRITSGKMQIRDDVVDLGGVVEAALDTILPDANEKSISISHCGDAAGAAVRGDATRLQQVFWNLLANATKFTPRGGRIETRVDRLFDQVVVTVSDTGLGIAPDFLPHVFERFRQADSSTTRKFGGLGLGLAIVKYIVDIHGGTIRAASDGPGKGASFIVSLPLIRLAQRADAGYGCGDGDSNGSSTRLALIASPSAPQTTGEGGDGEMPRADLSGVRVLIVDDDDATREIVSRILREYAAATLAVASADEAVEAFSSWRPDVLICDIAMPGRDGYSLIRELRSKSQGASTPAMALTAYTHAEDQARALAAGFTIHVCKPINPWELVVSVSELARHACC